MPKSTFHKLDDEKRKSITDAFLMEFSCKSFEDASITGVVKQLGIAKGSIYQYFEDKLDLFLYLHAHCNAIKMQYVGSVDRGEYGDFWTYYRTLHAEGITFDQQHPLESNFLHSLFRHMNAPSLEPVVKEWLKQVTGWMQELIRAEVEVGNFRSDFPIEAMAFMLFKVSTSINEYMQLRYGVDIESQIRKKKPIYTRENENLLLKTVDEYIFLLKDAFNNKQDDQGK